MIPEIRAARENETVKMVGGAHGINDDVGEGAGVEAFDLDVVTEGGEITIQGTKLAAAPVVVGVLRGRNRHFHLRSVRAIGLGILAFHGPQNNTTSKTHRFEPPHCFKLCSMAPAPTFQIGVPCSLTRRLKLGYEK